MKNFEHVLKTTNALIHDVRLAFERELRKQHNELSTLFNVAQTFETRLDQLEAASLPKASLFLSTEELDASVKDFSPIQNKTPMPVIRSFSQNSRPILTTSSIPRPHSLPIFSGLFFCCLCLSYPLPVDMMLNPPLNFSCALDLAPASAFSLILFVLLIPVIVFVARFVQERNKSEPRISTVDYPIETDYVPELSPSNFSVKICCMQILNSTYFFLTIIATIVSHFSIHLALLAAMVSILVASQPPENLPVCALEGQAYTKLTIKDKVLVALIDTGSALTLISQSILPLIGNPFMYPSPVPNAQSMSGIFPLLGVIYVDLVLPVNIIRKRIYVVQKTPYDLVLGTDLLSQPALRPIRFDFQLGTFRLGTNVLPLSTN
ncbi:MAG: retroviral-like aspartic protease, partial [bacterium]|nr:retroviral-like aspartic protease [bacterium]